jgi:hypothetical protein
MKLNSDKAIARAVELRIRTGLNWVELTRLYGKRFLSDRK